MKFRLLRGGHRVGPKFDKDGVQIAEGKTHGPNDVIESDTDLVKKFGREKFQRIEEAVQAAEEDEGSLRSELEQLTKAQLIERAEADELEIDRSMNKPSLVEAMLSQYEA